VFHAGQRYSAFQFYVASVSIFVAGVGALFADKIGLAPGPRDVAGIILSFAILSITICFWRLDIRNHQLVDCDERLLKDLEHAMRTRTKIESFETVATSDTMQPEFFCRHLFIMRTVFSIFLMLGVIFLLAFTGSLCGCLQLGRS
jgi:hypothetical protein